MKAEHCRSLDINTLRRDGEVVASIGLRASTGSLHLSYCMSGLGEEPEDISYNGRLSGLLHHVTGRYRPVRSRRGP